MSWLRTDRRARLQISTLEEVRGGYKRWSGLELPPVTHAELAGCARAALLRGATRRFHAYYRQYAEEKPFQWHPDRSHVCFWDAVLGPGWHGTSEMAAGIGRSEVQLLIAISFAFFAYPQSCVRGGGAGGAPKGEKYLEVAAALRRADERALKPLSAQGFELANAAGLMLAGKGNEAQAIFEREFGRTQDSRYELEKNHAMPLLTYALLNGVLVGASQSYLSVWLSHLRFMVQNCAWSAYRLAEQKEMMRFLDHVELVDGLINRSFIPEIMPEGQGTLSLLPFAMACHSLPACVRAALPEEVLVEAVASLAQDGLNLLASWGAEGLLQLPDLPAPLRKRLESIFSGSTRVLRRSRVSPSARIMAALHEAAKSDCRAVIRNESMLPVLRLSYDEDRKAVFHFEKWDSPRYGARVPVLRCMQKYAVRGKLELEDVCPVELTRLCLAMQEQVEVTGRLTTPDISLEFAIPQAVMLVLPSGEDTCEVVPRLRLYPGDASFFIAGSGLVEPVILTPEEEPLALRRRLKDEQRLMDEMMAKLRHIYPEEGTLSLQNEDEFIEFLADCGRAGVTVCGTDGAEMGFYQPQGGLLFLPGTRAGDWLEIGAELPVDEGRVLELERLLAAYAQPRRVKKIVRLNSGEYLLLNPTLERQLNLMGLVWREKNGKHGMSEVAFKMLQSQSDDESGQKTPPLPLPDGLQATLRSYQQEGYRWLAERVSLGMGAILADDMGLGKTVQVLALLLHAAQQARAGVSLVLAPLSLLGNWAEEAARFAPSLNVVIYDPLNLACLKGLGAGDLVLASYGQLASRPERFSARSWDVVVLDEAQAIKNPTSKRSRAACSLRARSRICLTGTPIENSLLDLWSEMRFLNPGLLGEQAAFLRYFAQAGDDACALLRSVLSPLVLRRTKKEVLRQLPPLTEMVEWVEFSSEERALYESLRRAAIAKVGKAEEASQNGVGILAELMRLRRACCHGKLVLDSFDGNSSKLEIMLQMVQNLRAAGRRALIFSQFTDVLDLAESTLAEADIHSLRLDGSTPSRQRSELVNRFQQGEGDVFFISLKAGGTGLNLTAADYVILLDPWWNPAAEAQAAGRSHRLGQQQPVTLCRLIVQGTVEERMLELHREKRELAESILGGQAEGISLASLRSLLGSE